MSTTYSNDIRPKFRAQDVSCMRSRGVRLNDAAWMCDPAAAFGFADHGHARHVFTTLRDGAMPPDQPWDPAWLTTYDAWMQGGFEP